MSEPLWKIEGFVTAAGNRVVQDWYWHDATIEERDALRDRMNYLAFVGRHLWQEPHFKWLGDIGEIRKKVPRGALRVYGCFAEKGNVFVFLLGTVKKGMKDTQGMDAARKRLRRLANGEGSTYGFDFEERVAGENQKGPSSAGTIGGLEPLRGNCVSDQGDARCTGIDTDRSR